MYINQTKKHHEINASLINKRNPTNANVQKLKDAWRELSKAYQK